MATLILKATEQCNSNCYYCDVAFKKKAGASMSLDLLDGIFRRINEYLEERPEEAVEIMWHGGEPLLVGASFYHSAWQFQEEHCPGTKKRIRHGIQTNMTCFGEEFVDIFTRLGINSVGTSYDPEPHMRGPGAEIDSATYNRRFMDGVKLLERHGIGWGMIYVVTKKSLSRPLDVFYFLTNMVLTGGVNFNPVLIYDQVRRDVAVTPGEYVEFLGRMFEVWWKHRDRYPNVQPFKALVETVIDGGMSLGCAESGSCTYHHLNITPDGETSQCGRSADWGLLPYGNIRDRTLAEIISDPQRNELHARVALLKEGDCRGCRFWELCHGGCPLDSYSQHRDFRHKSEWCEARRGFITKYFEPITGSKYVPRSANGPKGGEETGVG